MFQIIPWLIVIYFCLGIIFLIILNFWHTPIQKEIEKNSIDRAYKGFIELVGNGFIVKPVFTFWLFFFTCLCWLPLLLTKE